MMKIYHKIICRRLCGVLLVYNKCLKRVWSLVKPIKSSISEICFHKRRILNLTKTNYSKRSAFESKTDVVFDIKRG